MCAHVRGAWCTTLPLAKSACNADVRCPNPNQLHTTLSIQISPSFVDKEDEKGKRNKDIVQHFLNGQWHYRNNGVFFGMHFSNFYILCMHHFKGLAIRIVLARYLACGQLETNPQCSIYRSNRWTYPSVEHEAMLETPQFASLSKSTKSRLHLKSIKIQVENLWVLC